MNFLKNILRTHVEWVLVAMGILLVAVVGWILVWGVTILAQGLGTSLSAPKTQYAAEKFDLKGASELNLRGLE